VDRTRYQVIVRGYPGSKKAGSYDAGDEQTDHDPAQELQDGKSLLYLLLVATICRLDGWMVLILLRGIEHNCSFPESLIFPLAGLSAVEILEDLPIVQEALVQCCWRPGQQMQTSAKF
jgi:hypothetical protein